jgi:hypothetical protein
MTDPKEKRMSGVQRYFIASHRTCSLRIIAFDGLISTGHVVRIVNISVIGAGIESNELMAPGLVCFDEPVGGHKFGVVTWCGKSREGYRAGINFVTLRHDQEVYVLDQIRQSSAHQPLPDPENVFISLFAYLRRGNKT